MSDVININSKRPPVIYTVTIVHHYDDTIEFRVEDVADDERSREAVMSAFRRISGADEETERLRTDLRNAINCDSEYAKEIDEQNTRLRAENEKLRAENETHKEIAVRETMKVATLRAALKPFADLSSHWEGDKMPLEPKTIIIDPLPVLYAVKETRND